ncbi:hypothetical protein JI664_22340 [Rhodobacter sp. NTK016B]|uniref:phage head morphogenesis protein n=1 Tax=Rhodobacter sp. NTK016B TaxID=2759676 RepID=UPI001A8FA695|nr:phage minor head protein [Rhodobacter sp. NTK016B]MBN8294726.1 hypothetical protein [Rhodobacter sp. NTK016B]
MTAIELLPLPHREAIAYLRSKGFAPPEQRFDYRDVWLEEHARSWVVAKAMRDDVTREIRDAVTRVLEEGGTVRAAMNDLAPKLQRLGWWGRSTMLDPVTGEMRDVQLGSMRRLRVIFDTNLRTAHAAGHWAAIERTKRGFPYLQYIQIDRPTKRHDHRRFHDKIWRVDDPIWKRIYPPNGYFCGCHVIQRTEGWMRRNNRTVDAPAELDERPWSNERTGEITAVPRGVDPGFDSNPGAAWLDIREAVDRVMPEAGIEQRATAQGILSGLRAQTLARGAEGLAIVDAAGRPTMAAFGTREAPTALSVEWSRLAPGAASFRSYADELAFGEDLSTAFDVGLRSVTAITPSGALWSAENREAGNTAALYQAFERQAARYRAELAALAEGRLVYTHARALWLEKQGALTYRYALSERVRQALARNADLVRRLVEAAE